MIHVDRQDVAIKGTIVLLGIFTLVVMLLGWYYEAGVVVAFGVFGWLAAKKVKTLRIPVIVAVACGGLASAVGINRLVTHEIVVENRSGGVIPYYLLEFLVSPKDSVMIRQENFASDSQHFFTYRSLLIDGELKINGHLSDGSHFSVKTSALEEKYRRLNHVTFREGGEIEILRH